MIKIYTMATIDDFKNIEMRIGKILSAEPVPGSEKLLKLSVDFGPLPTVAAVLQTPDVAGGDGEVAIAPVTPQEREVRQILSGIAKYYSPEELVGKMCPFVTNLPPRPMMGLESNGMILAVKTADGGAVLLLPEKEVEPGSGLS
jgi:methionyl-tRNA synthetase